MEEIWKDVVGAEGTYQVSNQGRVRSVDRIDANGAKRNGIIISQKVSRSGYKTVTLYFNQRWHYPSVHRLVAEAFIPNPDNLPQVNHKDENKTGEAANSIGKPSSYISTCLIGKTKSCNGFIWRYKR